MKREITQKLLDAFRSAHDINAQSTLVMQALDYFDEKKASPEKANMRSSLTGVTEI